MNISVLTLELGAKQNSGRTNENADDKKNRKFDAITKVPLGLEPF